MRGASVRILGGGGEVGRLSILVKLKDSKEGIIVDSGVNFDEEDRPIFSSTYPPRYVNAIVLSHAHLDHIATAPMYFISETPRVYATKPTSRMAKLMLEDFLKLNGYFSPYEHYEVKRLLENVETIRFGQMVGVGNGTYTLEFYSAGHIPGSVFTVVNAGDIRVGITGDVNTIETKLMKPAQLDVIGRLDVLVTEATYGSTLHPPRRKAEERLRHIVEEVIDSGGTVLIPAFSIARGQEIMMVLAERDYGVPVYVDGMIRQVTEIFMESREYINNFSLLKKAYEEFRMVQGWRDRNKAWRTPSIIISSAGMLKGGPSLYYLKRMGQNPRNAIVLVSFQAPGSNGRKIVEEGVMPSGEPVRARVEWIDFSSHADWKGLASIVEKTRPSKVIIVHSEVDVAREYARRLTSLYDVDVIIGENEKEYVFEP
ncbi:MAG: MBL fold metallo-hydrolase [Hyperthermus sp.]|nr:MAG: MBL fold metallo-hydrolase [Hyperthermus sp.]